jgi:hypothetical protein
VFGIALLGAIVTSTFTSGFVGRLIAAGFPSTQASAIAGQAGAQAASGGLTVDAVLQHAPPGTTLQQAQAVVLAVKEAFVHAIHIGFLVGVGFMLVASVVSWLFVQDHTRNEHQAAPVAAL